MNFLKKILKTSRTEQDGIFFSKIHKITGFKPQNLEVYQRAFTHRSANKTDEQGNTISYERLEFLGEDRKSTRLNSSHVKISYAVFCLKKKTNEDLQRMYE